MIGFDYRFYKDSLKLSWWSMESNLWFNDFKFLIIYQSKSGELFLNFFSKNFEMKESQKLQDPCELSVFPCFLIFLFLLLVQKTSHDVFNRLRLSATGSRHSRPVIVRRKFSLFLLKLIRLNIKETSRNKHEKTLQTVQIIKLLSSTIVKKLTVEDLWWWESGQFSD